MFKEHLNKTIGKYQVTLVERETGLVARIDDIVHLVKAQVLFNNIISVPANCLTRIDEHASSIKSHFEKFETEDEIETFLSIHGKRSES